ncbi:MAG: calcineurin-like phosphoesterase family protein [Pseudomonadota bacterium]
MRFLKPSLFALGLIGLSGCVTIDYEVDFDGGSEAGFADYVGAPNIVRGAGDGGDMAKGVVFVDANQNSMQDDGERGLEGVKVSNGREVVLTDATGAYELPKRDDMAVFVIQPAGYQVPHNESWVPQFAFQHKPGGSPKQLRYGGLPATGPLPEAINFPLIKSGVGDDFSCAVLGDPQTYANQDISFFRDSTIDDLLDRNDETKPDCVLALGDVMGDDLGLIPRMAEVMSVLEAPQWWVHGNHDYDFDADFDEDSADSWRNLYGPNYFAFEIGDVLFISLDNVVYPCTAEDAKLKAREYCVTRDRKAYNGRITDEQMQFVENLLALTPEDKLVVVAHHIPFVSFVDASSPVHQTDNVTDLYALLEGREALSLSGHTHTIENFSPGDVFEGWTESVGVTALPFRHIIAGAGSGGWFHGDFDVHGVPMSLQRLGGPMGWLDLQFDGVDYIDTYYGANTGRHRTMWLSVNTPDFRVWFDTIAEWGLSDRRTRNPVPPLSINDLPDVKILTPEDLAGGSFLTANVWNGTTETTVSAEINGQTLEMERTQSARGDAPKIGAEWADPFATQRQLSVARFALQSSSGEARNQGYEAFKGSSFGPAAPQPQSAVSDRNMHLWRVQLPTDLPLGVHRIDVTNTDRHGRVSTDVIVIEVRDERPPMRFRKDVFFATPDGPPIR